MNVGTRVVVLAGQGAGNSRDDRGWFVRSDGLPGQAAWRPHRVRICRQSDSPLARSPPSCALSMLWSRRASPLPTRPVRPVYQRRPIIAGVRSSGHKTTSRRNARQRLAQDAPKRSVEGEASAVREPAPASKGHQDSSGFEE